MSHDAVGTGGVHVIIGLGGVGGLVMRLLTPYLWHQGRGDVILAVDGDTFELKNKARMAFSTAGPKAKVLVDELRPIYGDQVELVSLDTYVDEDNIGKVIREGDTVFCCPDNHKTRRLIELHCQKLDDVALFSGGNDGVEGEKTGTYGNVQVYTRSNGVPAMNTLSQFHPEIRDPQDKLPQEVGCMEQAHSAPQLVFTNAAVASAMTSAFYAWERGALGYEEAYLDIETGRVQPIARKIVQPRR
jgi:molybdopterin/thiamine biosynthesis adenylyltransferase